MATKVYKKKRVYRTQFKDLARGAAFWFSTDLTVAPVIKLTRTSTLLGWNTGTGAPTSTTVSDTSVAVVRVPGQFMGQNRELA